METSLKELGIQNQAMSFQEMANLSREKRAPVVQPPPPPVIPPPINPMVMPEPIMRNQGNIQHQGIPNVPMAPLPQNTLPQNPPPIIPNPVAPMLPFADPSSSGTLPEHSALAKCDPKPKGGFCMDGYQKEMIALALIAGIMSSSMAQDRIAQVSYFRDNRVLRAVASGIAVALVFTILKKFVF